MFTPSHPPGRSSVLLQRSGFGGFDGLAGWDHAKDKMKFRRVQDTVDLADGTELAYPPAHPLTAFGKTKPKLYIL